jgi:superfamily II DNA/RNA helicase
LKNTESLDLKNLESFIFEEADRTLDMGFRKDVEAII